MKQTNPQKRRQARLKTMVKPLVLMTALGLAPQVYAAPIASPFSHIPLHLDNTSARVKGTPPNIVVQFDDSGSMMWAPDKNDWPKNGAQSRMDIARSALKTILSNPEYTTDVNWAIISLWGNETAKLNGWSTRKYVEDYLAGSRPFKMEVPELLRVTNALSPSASTPAVHRYLDAMHLLRKELSKTTSSGESAAYRCQKSYIVVFSDGDGTGFINRPTVSGMSFTPSTTSFVYWNTYNDDFYDYERTWAAHNNPFTYSLANASQFAKLPRPLLISNPTWWGAKFGLITQDNVNGGYKWNMNNIANGYNNGYGQKMEFTWGWHPDSLPFLANLANNDLRTSADGKDAAGISWDDPTVVNGAQNNLTQNIQTFAIGFGAGLSGAGRYALDNMSTGNNFQALNASSEAELLAAFDKILKTIKSQNQINAPASIATISPSISAEDTVTQVPTAAASIHLDMASASSEIRFYKMNSSGTSFVVDDSNYTTPDFSERKALINEGGSTNAVSWFEAGKFKGSNAFFDLENASNANEWQNALMPWITRSKSDTEIAAQAGNSFQYRVRSEGTPNKRNMGDVVGASLYPIGEKKYGRDQYLITAANDGMVYLFESINNANHPYSLKLNYIPAGMQREKADDTLAKYFKHIANKDYLTTTGFPHRYMINADFTVRVTEENAPQRIFMSGNMGQGGRGSYSLNIGGVDRSNQKVGLNAPSSTWDKTVPLFETPKTGNNMGYTIGSPQIGRIATTRTIVFGNGTTDQTTDLNNVYQATFVNSGINNPTRTTGTGINRVHTTESALYVYSALNENVGLKGASRTATPAYKSGDLIQKITASANGGGLAQATIVDTNFDGVIDIAYAGDINGNLYRFDLRSNPGTWTATRIFTTQNNRPITSAPAVYRDNANKYIVVFGTGSDIYEDDAEDTRTQTVYGIYDDLTVQTPMPVTMNQLLKQSLILGDSVTGYKTRDLTENPINSNQKGWYFHLDTLEPNSGERVVAKPSMLLKTVLLTTRTYVRKSNNPNDKDVCSPSDSTTTSSSWIMQFRADTGGKLPTESQNGEDADLFAYVDFARANDTGKYKTRKKESMTAGYQISGGGVFSYALLFGGNNPSLVGNQGNAVSLDGDYTNGQETNLDENAKEPKKCTAKGSRNMVFGSNSTDTSSSGVNESVTVYAKECQSASLKRISWREIF